MKEFEYVVRDPLGIHARPAGQIARIAKTYADCVIQIEKLGGKTVDAARVMALMSMGAKPGDTLHITVEGERAEAAAQALEQLFTSEKL